jgi:hypothetical protein
MCLIKDVFVGEKNLDVTKMHGTKINKKIKKYINMVSKLGVEIVNVKRGGV